MQHILKKVLSKIKPSAAEIKKFQLVTSKLIKKINSQFKDAKAILGGSGAKDTWLSGSHDVDIFVQFDYKKYKDKSHELADYLEEGLKKSFPKFTRLHGSRDYFQIKHQNYLFEVVPILKITKSNQAVNITDISPLHAQWIKKNSKKIVDEIRLAKKFCRATGCYGAESHISGFSGYVIEILTVYYGGFGKLLKAITKWENRDVVDTAKYYKGTEALRKLNSSKLHSPLIVIDPVDKTRNAAAALSIEKFILFRGKVEEFLKNTSIQSFEKDKITFSKLEKNTPHNAIFIETIPLSGKNDVVGMKLLKVLQYLRKKLKEFDIEESDWDWEGNKASFYFILKKRQIDPFFVRVGPPSKLEKNVKDFKKANKETFEKRGRIMAKIPIKHFKLKDFVDDVLKDNFVKDRIKSVKKVQFG